MADKNIAANLDYYNEGFPTGKFSITVGGQWGPPRWYKNFDEVTDEGALLFETLELGVIRIRGSYPLEVEVNYSDSLNAETDEVHR